MDACDAVDGMRTDDCKPCHMNFAVFNDRHSAEFVDIAGITRGDVFAMAAVNFVDDHVNAGEEGFEHVDAPTLKGFGHNCVVGVGTSVAGDSPSLVPFKFVVVNEDAHEFSDAKCRVSVVDVDSNFFVELANVHAGPDVVTDDRLNAGGDEEVFLDETHATPFVRGIVGVEVLGNGFDEVAVLLFLAHLFMSEHAIIGEVAVNFGVPQS